MDLVSSRSVPSRLLDGDGLSGVMNLWSSWCLGQDDFRSLRLVVPGSRLSSQLLQVCHSSLHPQLWECTANTFEEVQLLRCHQVWFLQQDYGSLQTLIGHSSIHGLRLWWPYFTLEHPSFWHGRKYSQFADIECRFGLNLVGLFRLLK